MKLLPTLLLMIFCYSASAQNFRLQRIMYYKSIDNSALATKMEFYYPGNRGSDYKNGIINYDSAVSFQAANWPYTVFTKTYDTADRLLTDKSEDVYLPPPNYRLTKYTYKYDSLGRIAQLSYSHRQHRHYPTSSTTQNMYDSSGNLVEANTTNYSIYSQPWPSFKTTYLYDTANNNTRIVQQVMDTVNQVYLNMEKDSFVYNASNQWEEQIHYLWRDSAWQPDAKYEMDYKGGKKASEWLSYTYDTTSKSFLPRLKNTMKYNNLWDTTEVLFAYNFDNNGFVNTTMKLTVYNSYDQPDTVYYYVSNYSSVNPDTQLYFRNKEVHIYQVYWPTAIEEAITTDIDLKLYPVPARDMLYVSTVFKEPKPATITVYNMQGRVVYRSEEIAKKTLDKRIPLSGFAPGIYLLELSGADLHAVRRFTVSK